MNINSGEQKSVITSEAPIEKPLDEKESKSYKQDEDNPVIKQMIDSEKGKKEPPSQHSPMDVLSKSVDLHKEDVMLNQFQQHLFNMPPGPRRSSSRSIKRPKFDDELVDTSGLKRNTSRKTSESSPSEPKIKRATSRQTSNLQPKKKTRKIKPSPVPTDFGRWRPTDDLTLINAVTQTCDLQTVHLAVRFSCNFTLKEIQDRWFALLYDPLVSRLAQQSIKALPTDVVNRILRNVLWSREEDSILSDVNIDGNTTLDDFHKLLEDNIETFHKSRSAKTLQNHWLLLRHYQLLSCQTARISNTVPATLAEMEAKMIDDQITGPENDALNQELSYTDRCQKREIKRLEKEVLQWEVMIEKSGFMQDLVLSEFKEETIAILKGRILKYNINKNKVVIGRNTEESSVDINLAVEGPALKISREQGIISYDNHSFTLFNCGRRPFYVNGEPLSTGNQMKLINNSIIEMYCIKLLFMINPNLITGERSRLKDESFTDIQPKVS